MTPNEFLHRHLYPGECWHSGSIYREPNGNRRFGCSKCGSAAPNPNYSTMPIQDLIARLVELGEWVEFRLYAYKVWFETPGETGMAEFEAWLIQQPRFANLLLGYFPGYAGLFYEWRNL